MSSGAKLLVLTCGSPYAAVALAPLLLTRPTHVVGLGVSARPGPGPLATLCRVARRSGWRYAAPRAWSRALLPMLAAAERVAGRPATARRCWTFGELSARAGLALTPVRDVNGVDFARWLEQTGASALVSVYFDQILRPAVLERLSFGCYNLHPSVLPHHRGTTPVFWAMANGDGEAGVTLHSMTAQVDAGPIVAQRSTPLRPGETLSAVYLRCSRLAGPLLVDLADRLSEGTMPSARPQTAPASSESEKPNGAPTRAAVRAFLARGYRLV